MRLQRLVPAALMIASLVLIARADDPPKPDAKATPAKAEGLSKDEATIKQERLAAQFREFEQKLLRLAQRMETSSKAEDRDRAVMLKKAIELAGKEGTDLKFDRLVGLLKDSKALDLDSVVAIMEKNKDLAKDIREILKLLLMDNRDAELRAEIARLQDLIKKLNEI